MKFFKISKKIFTNLYYISAWTVTFVPPGVLGTPRRRRSFARKCSRSAPASLLRVTYHNQQKTRKDWSDECMTAALEAVKKGQSISQAACDHGVPKTTMYDRVSGRIAHSSKPGPKPYLTSNEESTLSSYLKQCARVGYGKTRRDVLSLVQNAASEKGVLRSGQVSQGWWRRFLEQQKDISLRQGDTTAHVRMDAMNKETVEHYFSLLLDVLSSHDLLNKPAQIYNVDETGVPLHPRPPKLVSPKGREMKKVQYRCSGRKGQITMD